MVMARDTQRSFTPAPEGLHPAVCVDIVDLGLQDTPWGQKPKVDLRFEIDEIDTTADPPRRFIVSQRYSLSLNEKATLRKHLEAWRGRKFSKEELQGFDLEKLLHVGCQIQVVHNVTDSGRVYANIQAIVPLGRGMTKLVPSGRYTRVKDRAVAGTSEGSAPADDDVPF